jgi:hypothetical protein
MVAMPILAAPETAAPCWRSRFHAVLTLIVARSLALMIRCILDDWV